jgi:hypothetical protein
VTLGAGGVAALAATEPLLVLGAFGLFARFTALGRFRAVDALDPLLVFAALGLATSCAISPGLGAFSRAAVLAAGCGLAEFGLVVLCCAGAEVLG